MTMTLIPGATTLAQLETLWREGGCLCGWTGGARRHRAGGGAGGTGGAGGRRGLWRQYRLRQARLGQDRAGDTAQLQRNLILSHCCGVGEALDAATTRLMMALKLLSLGRGASGVRWDICALIEGMLAADVVPVIPVQGSVGASGDLAPWRIWRR